MSRRQRPSAFEVSFPEEAEAYRAASEAAGSSRSQSVMSVSSVPSKRKNGDDGVGKKERPLPPSAHYEPHGHEVDPEKETEDLILPGEDDVNQDNQNDRDDKPIRVLRNFSIFDRKHMNEFVSLDFLEGPESIGREIVVVGYAKAYFEDRGDEDEGQEDDEDEGEEFVFLELSEVFQYTLDYGEPDDPVYILTSYAWYILDAPALAYAPFWQHFLGPKRVAQMVVSAALEVPPCSPEHFLTKLVNKVDSFGHTYVVQDLYDAAPEIYEAVLNHKKYDKLIKTSLIPRVIGDYIASTPKRPRISVQPTTHNQIPRNRPIGNPDILVQAKENQNATHVTPFIASLARGLVNENLQVVGSRLPEPDKSLLYRNKVKRCRRVKELLDRARKPRKEVDWKREDKLMQGYLKKVWVEGETYSVGDVILVPNGNHPFWEHPGKYGDPLEIPLEATIQDFFWFGRITFLDRNAHTAHLQWFEHGSGILLSELADDRQIFYTPYCESSVAFKSIVGKVNVHWNVKSEDMKSIDFHDFICNFMFNQHTGAFYDIAPEELDITKTVPPPDNCPSCLRHDLVQTDKESCITKDGRGFVNGFTYRGKKYHYEDFVLYYSKSESGRTGPANIGYIMEINVENGHKDVRKTVTCRKVGRIRDIERVLPGEVLRDEVRNCLCSLLRRD
ncbi:hypothetical protein NMY22_g16914 [Coprinellus aureogranulatus]|nr:hypothetical protein NMY22_g16914 [Coprinellus aureogranulatus]